MKHKRLYIIIGIAVVIIIMVAIALMQSTPGVSPQSIDDLRSHLDIKTREAFDHNIEAYTGSPKERFSIVESSYRKVGSTQTFIALNNELSARYLIEITPAEGKDFNYVYVSCDTTQTVKCPLLLGDD